MTQTRENVPEALKPLFSCLDRVEKIFNEKINRGADQIEEGAGEMCACIVPLYFHGERPENNREFWFEIGKSGGKTHQSGLVDYMLKKNTKGLNDRMGFFKVKSQMISTVSWFTTPECYSVGHEPTEAEVAAAIKLSKGILNVHREWTKYVNKKEREDAEAREEEARKHEQEFQRLRAKDMGFDSIEDLIKFEAEERKRERQEAEAAKLLGYVERGVVAAETLGDDGLFYIKHDGKLFRLSDLDTDRIRNCMIR